MYDVHTKLAENDLPIVIENDVWIGANVIILKGVTIVEGSVVAAGSIVTKSCSSYSILVGIPAKTMKQRFSEKDLKKHIDILTRRKNKCVE